MRRLLIVSVFALAAATLTAVWADPPTFIAERLVQVSGTSPFAACTADDVAGQPGTVFLDSEVEPWIDVNPRNPSHLVGGWQADRWSNGGARGLVAAVSFNGGKNWQQVVIPKITLCSGGTVANGGDFQRATDPWLTFAANGDVYFFSLALDITTPPNRTGGFGKNALFVSKSVDGGLTWGDPIKVVEDREPQFLNDKNAITADPVDPSVVYAVWDRLELPLGTVINPENVIGLGFRGPALFTRTTNAGQSWESPRQIYDPAGNNQTIGNQVAVMTDGTVVNFFNEILNFRNDDHGAQFEFNLSHVRSADKGATWPSGPANRGPKMQSLALVRLFGVIDPDTGAGIRTGDVLFDVAVDRSPGSAAFGTVYAVWQDARFSGFRHDEVAFARSTDGGLTWTAPVKVNRTPASLPAGNRQAFTPSVHVAADGTIGVTYYDFRNNTPDPATLPTDYFIVHCHPATSACASLTDWIETRLTNAPFDMRRAPLARGFFTGDYEGLTAAGNKFAAFFSQSHGSDPSSVFFRKVGP
jgi:hypothetical protein